MLRCPLCNHLATDLSSLKKHFGKHNLSNKCPVCGKEVKRLSTHIVMKSKSDDEHAVYYALVNPSVGSNRHDKKHLFRCRELATKKLEVLE